MKASLEQMKAKFLALSQNRADELAQIYGGPGAESLDRPAQWAAICDDAPSNRGYLANALGMGKDGAPVEEEPEPSADDRAAKALLENPTLSPREITVEAAAKATPARRPRTNEELAEALYGRR